MLGLEGIETPENTGILRRAFSSVVKKMTGYTTQRRGTVHTLPN